MIALAVIATLESVVHLGRIRAAVSDRAALSGFMTFCTCALRVGFVMAGASAVLAEPHPLSAVAVYGGTAAGVTWALQWVVSRMEAARDG